MQRFWFVIAISVLFGVLAFIAIDKVGFDGHLLSGVRTNEPLASKTNGTPPNEDDDDDVQPSVVEVDKPKPPPDEVPVHKPPPVVERVFNYYCVLRDATLTPLAETGLVLATKGKRSPVFTRDDGTCGFAITQSDLPARLEGPGDALLLAIHELPSASPVHVNLQRLIPAAPEHAGLIVPTAASIEEGIDGCWMRVYGTTLLDRSDPENRVFIRLGSGEGERTVAEVFCYFEREELLGEIHLSDLPYSGRYVLDLLWKPDSSTAEERDRVAQLLRAPPTADLRVRRAVYLGSRAEEEKQEREADSFYNAALDEAVASTYMIYTAANRLRIEDSKGQLKIPSRHEPLVEEHPAYATLERLFKARRVELAAWRTFIDKDLPAAWSRYVDLKTIPLKEKYPDLAQSVVTVFRLLSRFKKLESQLYYRSVKQPPDAIDFCALEFEDAETDWRFVRDSVEKSLSDIQELLARRAAKR